MDSTDLQTQNQFNEASARLMAKEIVNALQEADRTHLWVNREEHAKHHAFLDLMLKRQEEREARNERIKERIAGSAILAGGLWLIGIIGHYSLDMIKNILNAPK